MLYTHTVEYYSAIENNEILPFETTWIDLEGIMLNEISQTEKEKYCIISIIYVIWNENKWTCNNSNNKTNQICKYREKTGGCQRRVGGGKK